MNPGDADWWWQYGFDGIAGGVIGGAVTAGAVVATLRHERERADLEAARAVAARLHGMAWHSRDLIRKGPSDEAVAVLSDMVQVAFELSSRCNSRWPKFSSFPVSMVDAMTDRITPVPGSPTAVETATTLMGVLGAWIGDPKFYESGYRKRLKKARNAARNALRWVFDLCVRR